MNKDVHRLTWPASRLGEAIEALARKSGLSPRHIEAPNPPCLLATSALSGWVESTAGLLGLEAEPVETTYREVDSFLQGAAPAVVPIPHEIDRRYLALLDNKGRHVSILAPDLSTHRLRRKTVCDAIAAELEAPIEHLIERMVGHRTRLAQEERNSWHEGEDQMAERYLASSGALD